MKRNRWFLGILFTLAVLLASLLLPAQAAPPTIPIRLQSAVFDPLLGEPDIPAEMRASAQGNGPATWLVQFDGPVQAAWKEAVQRIGVRLYGYIPEYAFLARMDAAAAEAVRALPHVRWVGLYHPAYRLAPDLQASEVSKTSEVWVVTVQALPDADLDALTKALQGLGGQVRAAWANELGGFVRVRLPVAALLPAARLDEVLWIERYREPELLNDVGGGQIMRAGEIRTALGLYGSGQTVAVCDTGLDTGNETTLSADFKPQFVKAYALGRPGDWSDDNGHGTHVAGSVLGNGTRSGSDPGAHDYSGSFAGVAPEASLVFQSVLDAGGGLGGLPADYDDLFGPAYNDGARIHTNSWGAPVAGIYTTESAMVDSFTWNHPDMLILYAAGNEGVDANADGVVDADSMGSPATAKNALTVGASENLRPTLNVTWGSGWPSSYPANPIRDDRLADDDNGMAAFSSRGPTDDGRIKPDITAPGTFIISVRSHDPAAGTGWGVYNDDYLYMGGTSMATPLTAGAAAIVREWLTEQRGVSSPSGALMKAVLLNGAADMAPGQYGTGSAQEIPDSRPNPVSGWGRVDLVESLNPPAPRRIWFDDHTGGLSTGGSVQYQLTMGQATNLSVGQVSNLSGGQDTILSNRQGTILPNGPAPAATPSPVGQVSNLSGGQDTILPNRQGTILSNRQDAILSNEDPSGAAGFVGAGGHRRLPWGTSQLLQNEGFETGGWSPWETYGSPYLTSIIKHTGSWSAHAGNSNGADDEFWQQVDIPADAGDVTIDFWYRLRTNEIYAGYDYFCYGIWNQPGTTAYVLRCADFGQTGDVDWSEETYSLDETELANVQGQTVLMGFYVTTDSSFSSRAWVDDTALYVTSGGGATDTPTPTPTDTPTPTPTPTGTPSACPEAIADGGFEQATGDTSHPNWRVSGNARFTVNQGIARSGQDAAILGYTSSPATGELWQAVSVPADVSAADLSFWYQSMGDGSFTASVDVTDSSGGNVLVHLADLNAAGFTWQQFSHTFTAGELAAIAGQSVRLRFSISGVTDPEDLVIDDVSWTLCTGGTPTTCGPFRLTLAWTDYPGQPSAAKELVNDLDLEVIAPDGTHYYGNQGLYTSGQCLRDGQWDACNNVEGLILPEPDCGTYTVIVHGQNVAQGAQPFALVASGDNLREGTAPGYDYAVYLPLVLRNR